MLRVTVELMAGQVWDLLFLTPCIASDHKSNSQNRGMMGTEEPSMGCGWTDGHSPHPDYSQSPAVTWISRAPRRTPPAVCSYRVLLVIVLTVRTHVSTHLPHSLQDLIYQNGGQALTGSQPTEDLGLR